MDDAFISIEHRVNSMETKMTNVIGKVEKALEKLEQMEPRKGSALSKGIRNIASAKGTDA